ncbi:MAG: bicyclomycin resistance protein [Ramlibacter sp.]|nr:bicyclomycin resistance protein [Ramlibacter sp.]
MNLKALAPALCLCLALATAPAVPQPAPTQPQKVFRYGLLAAETGFDPAQISDLYSSVLVSNMFDAPYCYDYLARPAKVRPNLAADLPIVSADFKTFTFKLRPGIYFADDPAFGGKKREVTAADFIYTLKRIFDPKTKSPRLSSLAEEGILGLDELNKQAQASGKFDYGREAEGARALDRYTVQIKLAQPRPRFVSSLADPAVLGIVAREVVEMYGDRIMEHPVGTGPFMLSEWKRSSKMTFIRNPNFREEFYQAEPNPEDAKAQEIYQLMKGKRLPMVDRVEVSVIEEPQPRWLAFLNNEQDWMERLPQAFANQAIPNDKLAPNLAKRGITMDHVPLSDVTYFWFRMDHPIVGGYTPDKVALRRAISLAYNSDEEVRLARRNQAIVAQGPVMPLTRNYDPTFRSDMGVFDRARAIALLDMYGYVDKDGDGWRDMPDGRPLVLEFNTLAQADYREQDEIVKKNLDAVGIRTTFKVGKFGEQLRAARAGKLMMWQLGLSAGGPDGGSVLELGYSPSIGQLNHAAFKNERFDELYRQQNLLPDGPERQKVIQEAVKILVAYAPYKFRTHRIATDLSQPWFLGYKRHPSLREFWKYVDIDTTKLPK